MSEKEKLVLVVRKFSAYQEVGVIIGEDGEAVVEFLGGSRAEVKEKALNHIHTHMDTPVLQYELVDSDSQEGGALMVKKAKKKAESNPSVEEE